MSWDHRWHNLSRQRFSKVEKFRMKEVTIWFLQSVLFLKVWIHEDIRSGNCIYWFSYRHPQNRLTSGVRGKVYPSFSEWTVSLRPGHNVILKGVLQPLDLQIYFIKRKRYVFDDTLKSFVTHPIWFCMDIRPYTLDPRFLKEMTKMVRD